MDDIKEEGDLKSDSKSSEDSNAQEGDKEIKKFVESKLTGKYELTLICFNQYNEEIIKKVCADIFGSYDSHLYKIEKMEDISRYDIIHHRRQIKINMITVYFKMDKKSVRTLPFVIYKYDKVVLRHMLIANKYYIYTNIFDYKKPINLKKHLFESQRIMPRELNRLNKRQQRVLAQNIKRCRILGLFGTAGRSVK